MLPSFFQVGSTFYNIETQILSLMTLLIVVPELIKGFYYASQYPFILFDFLDKSDPLGAGGRAVARCFMVVMAPLIPSVMLMKRFRVSRSILNLELTLHTELNDLRNLKREEEASFCDFFPPAL